MKKFIFILAAMSVFPAAAQAAAVSAIQESTFCSAIWTTLSDCEISRSIELKSCDCALTSCTYTGEGYQWCTSSAGSSQLLCAYSSKEYCLIMEKTHKSCALDLSTGCYYPTDCASGFYPSTDNFRVVKGSEVVFPACEECPANATCDGKNVFCDNGYTLTSKNPGDHTYYGGQWCVPSTEEKIGDAQKTGEAVPFASIEGECPDGLRKSSDGCCCLK